MPDLTLYGHPVRTVFDLLGKKANDLTYSLGWGLEGASTSSRPVSRSCRRPARAEADRERPHFEAFVLAADA